MLSVDGVEDFYWWEPAVGSVGTQKLNTSSIWVACCERVPCANAFRMGSSTWFFSTRSCACASICFVAGITSLALDYILTSREFVKRPLEYNYIALTSFDCDQDPRQDITVWVMEVSLFVSEGHDWPSFGFEYKTFCWKFIWTCCFIGWKFLLEFGSKAHITAKFLFSPAGFAYGYKDVVFN